MWVAHHSKQWIELTKEKTDYLDQLKALAVC
jgi:hypothetical protein